MLAALLLTLSLALPAQGPLATELELVRSRMGPLVRVAPDGSLLPLGPPTPRGFGLEAGRLRHLATSTAAGVVVVEVADARGGALFAVPLAGGAPVELAKTTALGLDVALSPDGRRLLYEDARAPRVVTLVDRAPAPPVATIATRGPAAADPLDVRITGPRWRDDRTVVYEREVLDRRKNHIATTLEIAPADGSAPAELLVPPVGAQDRLAAVVGDGALFYRDGVLHRHAPDQRAPRPVGTRHEAYVVGATPDGARAVIAFGSGGVTREGRLAVIDAAGVVTGLTATRTTYLDPRLTRDGAHVLWSVRTSTGWVVERVALGDGARTTVAAAHADPVELVADVPGSSLVAGCRGDEVVVIDAARGGARALTRAADQPSCTVRGATPSAIVFERKLGDAWRLELLPLAPGAAPGVVRPGASVASTRAIDGDTIVAQTGWDGVGTIVARALGREVTLVPWQHDDLVDARRTPDGSAVVYRIGAAPAWFATRLAAPGVIVPVTGDAPEVVFVGLTRDRLVGWSGGRFLAWRLDGRDAGAPAVVLDGIAWAGPFAADHARVIGVTAAGALVSAPVAAGATPTVLLTGVRPWSIVYDRAHSRVIASAIHESRLTILAVDVLGADADRPHVLGHPRPREHTGLGHIDVLPTGNVTLGYVTTTMGGIHPAGSDVLAWDGSGYRERRPAIAPALPSNARPDAPLSPPAPDPWSGAEIRTPIR